MATGDCLIDWEPVVPGSWPSDDPRQSRKRTSSQAGFNDVSPFPTALSLNSSIASTSSQLTNDSPLQWAKSAFTTVVGVVWNLATNSPRSLFGDLKDKKTIEIRRVTSSGFESVKRRATDSTRVSQCDSPSKTAHPLLSSQNQPRQALRSRRPNHDSFPTDPAALVETTGLYSNSFPALVSRSFKASNRITMESPRPPNQEFDNSNSSDSKTTEMAQKILATLIPKPIKGLDYKSTPQTKRPEQPSSMSTTHSQSSPFGTSDHRRSSSKYSRYNAIKNFTLLQNFRRFYKEATSSNESKHARGSKLTQINDPSATSYAIKENDGQKSEIREGRIEIDGTIRTQDAMSSAARRLKDSTTTLRHALQQSMETNEIADALASRHSDRPAGANLEVAMSEMDLSEKKLAQIRAQKAVRDAARIEKERVAELARKQAEEAERKAKYQRRMPKRKLVQPLDYDWSTKLDNFMDLEEDTVLTSTSDGTNLRVKDFATVLGRGEWLNDEIINGYINWIIEDANKKSGRKSSDAPKFVAQSSFFYGKISKDGPQSVARWMKRKKAGGPKLLEVEVVLMPVNSGNHWTLLVVSPGKRTIEYLDSFHSVGSVPIKHVKAWLKVELGSLWSESDWTVLDTKSTLQTNGYDCGVFVATNAECVVGGVSTSSYDESDLSEQRKRIAAVLLNKGFGTEFVPAIDL